MPMTHGSNVVQFPACRYADGATPGREDDERLLSVIAGLEARGRIVTFEPEPAYVSPYLERPLRGEAEVRAKRLHPLFAAIVDMVRP